MFRNALRPALRTIFLRKCNRLQDFSYSLKKFSGGHTPVTSAQASPVLEPDTNCCLAHQRFHYSCFTKRPLICNRTLLPVVTLGVVVRVQTLMEKRIRPWVNKKIVEYIGEDEPTLSDFICKKVISHSSPSSILADISMVSSY